MSQKVKNKNDALTALSNAGIDDNFLDQALKIMDSPKVKKLGFLTSFLGINTSDIKRGINDLKGGNAPKSIVKQVQNTKSDSLASLKSGLLRRK